MARKILMIEDDLTLSESFTKTMKDAGYDMHVANDGETGFRQAEELRPDLILLDLVLPKKHGFKVMEDLKNNPELRSIPVVVLTNLETPHDIERASTLGAKAYLVKANYSLSEIRRKVEEILANQ